MIGGGKRAIPGQFRKQLGTAVGDTLLVETEDGEMHVRPLPAAVRRAQAIVRGFVPDGTNLVDQLIEERRAQAADD